MTAGFLLHRKMGQKGGLTVGRGEKTMAQHGVLSEVDLQNVAVGRGPLRQDDLHQIQLRFFLQQQQDPRRDQPFATGQHQLQRGDLAPDPQGQKLLTAGVVELHPPGFGATTAIQGVTERLLELRPVLFRFKQAVENGEDATEFGLIAEEVAEVFPELVVYDENGKPFTVKYHLLSSMLLNELQKLHGRIEAQEARLDALVRALTPATTVSDR